MRFDDLHPDEQRELRRIRVELEAFPFVERTWFDRSGEYVREGGYGTGRGARHARPPRHDRPFADGAGGAPVYHDIQGDISGTRRQVLRAIERFERGGTPSSVAMRALAVARRRLIGDVGLSTPLLPPDAGDCALDPLSERTLQRLYRMRQAAAKRAWVTIRARYPHRTPPPPDRPSSADPDRAKRLSEAARKAWDTRRARSQGVA
jgi:hypothetical protein